ncbi:hypothetical protein HHL17_23210 [Chitinophaga sp. G-6-1-13]|uniref:Uncharacterized protein n=1 Tax=Chitinophaga fulva TaxID=2728842 RepID=A0A848GQ89_9BACT|nr:hypothetical protein [Chitinophaga fulva]NML40127.1 hypothetical protein [Chitinophaga fulva]
MHKQPLVTLVSLFVFIMMPFVGKAQMDSLGYRNYLRAVISTPHMPLAIEDYGGPTELTIVCTISKGVRTVRYFPGDTPDSIRLCLRGPEKVIMTTDWEKIFPSLSAKGDFSVVVPVILRIVQHKVVTSRQEQMSLDRLFNFADKVALPYRVCDPVFMNFHRKDYSETGDVFRL